MQICNSIGQDDDAKSRPDFPPRGDPVATGPKIERLPGWNIRIKLLFLLVEPDGIEPTTSSMPLLRKSIYKRLSRFL